MQKVLITGVNGFVGKKLADELITKGFKVNGAARSSRTMHSIPEITKYVIKDLDANTDWQQALASVSVVIHLAARVHVMKDTAADVLAEFRKVNVAGTLNLARQAVEAGVQRYIFISSIKVNGEVTVLGRPFMPDDQPAPVDPYGVSKCEAEAALRQLARETAMEVVIIRPPLVYGPGVKANFHSMMDWLDKGIPLPLGAIHNQRSLVALDNLIDLIITCIKKALESVNVVIHLAARVHVMKDTAADALAEFRKVNVEGTLNLARQAVEAGVQRFIFISSIKVNGEGTVLGRPYRSDDQPEPVDPYGISKCEAEAALRQLAREAAIELVIIRPPLVYGPGVKANFRAMMSWLYKGIPLPLGAIHNQRSLVALDNLIDLIITCVDHPAAANQIFLAGDGEDLSTTDLLRRMAAAMGKKSWLVPVPSLLVGLGCKTIWQTSHSAKTVWFAAGRYFEGA